MKQNCLFLLIVFVVFLTSCNNDELTTMNEPTPTTNVIPEGMMQMGEKIENPYSIKNMQKAVDNLFEEGKLKSKPIVETTHYYVRFLPKTFKGLDMLKRDTSLYFYDFPLLCKIKKKGTSYHDPELPADQITWQYTVVPKDYHFDSIKYEILDNVFMEDEKDNSKLKSASIDNFTFSLIEEEAYRITGEKDKESKSGVNLKSTSWSPSGTVRVEEERVGGSLRPLNGVYVRARNGLKTRHGFTNSSGQFTIDGSFTADDVDMCVIWDRYEFNICDGSYYQAYTYRDLDLKRNETWTLKIGREWAPKSWLFAHIHDAAHTYYYCNSQWGIKPPSSRGWILGQQLHIAAQDQEGRSHYFSFNDFWYAATVVVYSSQNSDLYEGWDVFDTTIHELAHVSHWEFGYSVGQYMIDFISNSSIMTESWATCVAWQISTDIYNNVAFFSNYPGYQTTNIGDFEQGYTSLFIDCIDSHDQGQYFSTRPDDRVEGYTLSQLEYVLGKTYIDLSAYSLQALAPIFNTFAYSTYQKNLRDSYPNNPTKDYIDELFDCF